LSKQTTPELFLRFVSENGRKLSEVNPGSTEFALTPAEAIVALDFLSESRLAILGGDVLSDSNGKLSYIYEHWYCEQSTGEAPSDFIRRSQTVAREFIGNLVKRKDANLFVVLVHSTTAAVSKPSIKEILEQATSDGRFSIEAARAVVQHDWRGLIGECAAEIRSETETLFYFIEGYVEEVEEGYLDESEDPELYTLTRALLKKL
jgi:hypothetical protein